MQLNGRKEIIKLNEKTIMVLLDYKKIYLINIKTMKINEFYWPFKANNKIVYIYNDKNNLYIYENNILYYYIYIKNEFNLIKLFKINENNKINYFLKIYIEKKIMEYNWMIGIHLIIDTKNLYVQRLKEIINKQIIHEFLNYKLKEIEKKYKNKFIKIGFFLDVKKNKVFEQNKGKIKNKIIKDKSIMKRERVNYNIKKPKNFKKKFR